MYLEIAEDIINTRLQQIKLKEDINLSDWMQKRKLRDGNDYHITVVNHKVMKTLKQNLGSKHIDVFPKNRDYFIIGMVVRDDVIYMPCCYPAGVDYCRENSIIVPDFHITIGFAEKDNHEISKSIQTITDTDYVFVDEAEKYIDYLNENNIDNHENVTCLQMLLSDNQKVKEYLTKYTV